MTDTPSTVKVEPPTERGFYKYDGGKQKMIFLLGPDNEWFAYFDNAEGPMRCGWGYIEQALGVYNLVPIVSEAPDKDSVEEPDISGVPEPQVVMELPVFLPGNNRNWVKVDGRAQIESTGTVIVTLTQPEMSAELVEMAKSNFLLQVAFDYKMPLDQMEKINNQFQMEYADDDTLFKAYDAVEGVLGYLGRTTDVINALLDAGIIFKEMK